MNLLMIILSSIIIILLIILIVISLRCGGQASDRQLADNFAKLSDNFAKLNERFIRLEASMDKITPKIDTEFRENRKEISTSLQNIQKTVDTRVKSLQDDNAKKLEQMRETVDEKLQKSVEKRFNESFKTISGQLTQVYEGLGEMKNLATGVGDLKKVMEGVKTRGIYGEVQLEAIIADTLTPDQYEKNFATRKGATERVEFAVKMPGKETPVYLPIDSKFPVENYSRLVAAYDAGDKEKIATYQKALANDVKTQAKKISTKYLEPPLTTDYGMMFVPTESLHAEILRIPGLADEIRQKYHVNLTSPSTLPTMLSGLLMGFRTIAIEKRSSEIWQTLGAVKTQFGKFGDLLGAVKKKLQETTNKIESAETTSRQIERKLKDVETLPEEESVKLIGKVEE